MSGGVRVREFTLAEVGLYRELRLAALQDAPDAFCATYAEEAARQDWPARLAENVNDERGRPVIARVDGTAAGLAVGKIWPAEPDVAQVYQMWVAPAFRGRGAARALLEDIIAGARERGASAVALGVTCGDSPARRLYERAGFRSVGEPSPMRPGSALQCQDMVLRLG